MSPWDGHAAGVTRSESSDISEQSEAGPRHAGHLGVRAAGFREAPPDRHALL